SVPWPAPFPSDTCTGRCHAEQAFGRAPGVTVTQRCAAESNRWCDLEVDGLFAYKDPNDKGCEDSRDETERPERPEPRTVDQQATDRGADHDARARHGCRDREQRASRLRDLFGQERRVRREPRPDYCREQKVEDRGRR